MKILNPLAAAGLAVALTCGLHGDLSAQVVEERDSEANPAASIFKATLYGAATGLALGGAYALVNDDVDDDGGTSDADALRWGTAIGAVGGLVVGLM